MINFHSIPFNKYWRHLASLQALHPCILLLSTGAEVCGCVVHGFAGDPDLKGVPFVGEAHAEVGDDPSCSHDAKPYCKATLVICPLVAVIQWRQEIARYVAPGGLKVSRVPQPFVPC